MNHVTTDHLEHEYVPMPFDYECAMGLSQLGGWVELLGRWLCSSDSTKSDDSDRK